MYKLLANPKKLQKPIKIKRNTLNSLKNFLETMTIIRKTEQQLAFGRAKGLIGGPVHLGVCQEVISLAYLII